MQFNANLFVSSSVYHKAMLRAILLNRFPEIFHYFLFSFFLVEKQTVITNSTQYPFWRWSNFIYRTWTWSWNLLFILLILVPWCSTFSLRSLLYLQPFYPDLEISHQDGSLHRDTQIYQKLSGGGAVGVISKEERKLSLCHKLKFSNPYLYNRIMSTKLECYIYTIIYYYIYRY